MGVFGQMDSQTDGQCHNILCPSWRCWPSISGANEISAKKVAVAVACSGFPLKWFRINISRCVKVWWVRAASFLGDLCLLWNKKRSWRNGKQAIIDARRRNHHQLRGYAVIRPRSLCSHATMGTDTLIMPVGIHKYVHVIVLMLFTQTCLSSLNMVAMAITSSPVSTLLLNAAT